MIRLLGVSLFMIPCAFIGDVWHTQETIARMSAIALSCLVVARGRFKEYKTPLFYLPAIYGILMAILFIYTPRSSLNYRMLINLWTGLLFFYATTQVVTEMSISRIRKYAVAAGIALSAFVIFSKLFLPYPYNIPITVMKNNIGMILIMAYPLCGTWISAGIISAGVLLSNSTGGIMAWGMVSIITIISHRSIKIALVALAVALVFLCTDNHIKRRMIRKISYESTVRESKQRPGGDYRVRTYKEAWGKVKDSPVIGYGIGNMVIKCRNDMKGAHNMWLDTWGSGGFLAVLLMIGIFISMLRRGGRMSLSVLSYLFYANFVASWKYTPCLVFFWVIAALILSSSAEPVERRVDGRGWLIVPSALIAILLVVLAINLHKAKCAYLQSTKQKNPRKAITLLDRAIGLEPRLFKARYDRGWCYYELRNYPRAIADLELVEKWVPDYYETRNALLDCYAKTGRKDEFVRLFYKSKKFAIKR